MRVRYPFPPPPTAPLQGSCTRFAPAPTGWLHLGHVLNALHVWNAAHALGARVVLRIEDHDRERSRPAFEAGILDDLDWLGFAPDVHPTAEFREGRCEGRQSDREAVYEGALQLLLGRKLVYACGCSRRALAAGEAPGGIERVYPGTCRDLGLPLAEGYGLRVALPQEAEAFDDGLLGPQVQAPFLQCGDMLIRDRVGNWTYQFAAAVDDHAMGIDLVIRGRDLLASTGRQIQVARLLGRPTPATFLHHPLVMKSADQKLSKSDLDVGVRDLRAAGWTPDDVFAEVERAVTRF
ncbi:MAG: hypothetical protein H0U94_10475 [Acidobacteria bacterium]|nr:hypothetical protein [Acidobacteriota bacterium]